MELRSTLTTRVNQVLPVVYSEGDPLVDLEEKILQGIHCFFFYDDKLVIVHAPARGAEYYWTPLGGGVEPGETFEQAVIREVKEETNMRITYQKLIGFQDYRNKID